jgi:hypothetical protein
MTSGFGSLNFSQVEADAVALARKIGQDGKAALIALLQQIGGDTEAAIPTISGDVITAVLDFVPEASRTLVGNFLNGSQPWVDSEANAGVQAAVSWAVARVNAIL